MTKVTDSACSSGLLGMTIVGRSRPIGERSAHRVCHWAPSKPTRKSLNVGGCPIQPDLPPLQGFEQAHAAQPNSVKRQMFAETVTWTSKPGFLRQTETSALSIKSQ